MTSAVVPTSYASVTRRFFAFMLDLCILAVPASIAVHALPVIGGLIVWFMYAPILEASELQATLGKYVLGLQVTDLKGERLSFRIAFIRNLLKTVSTALLFVGFIVALFSSRKQTLHDLLAETLVTYGRNEVPIGESWMKEMKSVIHSASGEMGRTSSSATEVDLKPRPSESIAEQIERLQALRDRGSLSEDEFQIAKRKILGTF